jgi:hypothetical protein
MDTLSTGRIKLFFIPHPEKTPNKTVCFVQPVKKIDEIGSAYL